MRSTRASSPVRRDPERAGTNADDDVALACGLHCRLQAVTGDDDIAVGEARRQQVHRRAADEGGDVDRIRSREYLGRRADLLDFAGHEHRHAVGQRHRLFLVVRHVDGGDAERALQLLQLGARFEAQLGVEVGQRLVEQEQARLAHDGARQRAALLLAARELAGLAIEQMVDLDLARGFLHRGLDLGRRELGHLQREGDVLVHGHVRVERVALEHHGDVALARVGRCDVPPSIIDPAGGRRIEARQDAQRGALAGAGRAQQHEELAGLDLEVTPFSALNSPCLLTMSSKRT